MNFTNCLKVFLCLSLTLGGFVRSDAVVNVTQFHNHLSRDGLFIDPAFTVSNAANLSRDLSFNGTVSGNVYAQPLYIEGGPRGRAVIIAVTESNNVYALDALTGVVVWQTNVAPSVKATALPCGNISPFGITGTPVVDVPSRALFFDALTEDLITSTISHLVFSLNVDTGALNPGWPVNVNNHATFGTNHFVSLAQGERGALTVVGSNLYVPYGGMAGDCSTYFGWVVGFPFANPTNVMAWATTARGGGIWAVGGIASDGTDVFVATGNTFGASTWGGGEAIVHLPPNLALPAGNTNFWAPTNWTDLDGRDLDLGGSGPVLVDVPGATPSTLVIAFGKDTNIYVLNRTNLGGITAPITQLRLGSSGIIQAGVTYRTSLGSYVAYANGGNLRALRLDVSNPPDITLVNTWIASEHGNGSPFVTSTDGTNNVIVWGIGAESDQRLHSFDGDTGANIFTGGGANELMAGTHRFSTAIAARGRIYVGTDNKIYAFKVPGQNVTSIAATNLTIQTGGVFGFSFTNIPGALFNVFGTTNLNTPFTNWSWVGEATETSSGHFQFIDTPATNSGERFFRVVAP